jgi:L-iditol 2-dehydrogenase
MKALVLVEYNRLECLEVPDPVVGSGQVLIRVEACGICGSDVHGLDGSTGRRLPPVIMGHEAAGVVEDIGAHVAGRRVGDRVTFDPVISCGVCHFCQCGLTNLCDSRRLYGVSCDEYRQDGAFAEFVAVPARSVYALPEGLSFEQGALAEPLSVAAHAVGLRPVAEGDVVVVVGAGVIGLMAVQVLRASGCRRVIAVDLDEGRLALARKLGADKALKAAAGDTVREVRGLTEGRGADAAIEAVGVSETVRLAIQCVRKGGAVTLVGNLSPTAELPLQAVVTREVSLLGSYVSRGEWPTCLDLLARRVVETARMVSAVAPLAEGAAWFRRLQAREAQLVKVVLSPTLQGGDGEPRAPAR